MPEILVESDDTSAAEDAQAFAAQLTRATGASMRLIVVGSTHRGGIGRLLHRASCPVAVVPRGYAQRSGDIASIGVGYNASAESVAALSAAYGLARRLGAELRVVHVYDASMIGRPALMTGPAWSTMRDDHETAQRAELAAAMHALPPDVDAYERFVIGSPAEELARLSETVDLMVVGSRGYAPPVAWLLGSVSRRLLARAASPVIVVPRGVHGGLDALDCVASHGWRPPLVGI